MPLCPSCGTNNVEGTKFCVACGSEVMPAPAPESWRVGTDELGRQPDSRTATPPYPPPASHQPSPFDSIHSTPFSPAVAGAGGAMNYATWADRVLAALVDGFLVSFGVIALYIVLSIIGVVLTGAGAALGGATGSDDVGAAGSLIGSSFCCIAFVLFPLAGLGVGLYNKVYLVAKRGSSIGQGLMQLKVVTAQGGLVPQGTLLLRLLVQAGFGIIPFLPLLSILWPLWDEKRQALHDKAVDTYVVKVG